MATTITTDTRALNHVELVYAPGERPLARALFEVLGFDVRDSGGPFLTGMIQTGQGDFANNALYASEVTAEQWVLEQALRAEIAGGALAGPTAGYLDDLRAHPQRSCHFGIRYPTVGDHDAVIDRIVNVEDHAPDLVGRVILSGVFRPGDPGSYTDTMTQAFVRTDVIASGLLAFGQHIELQWQVP
ncbi:MAG: hypothetical protein FJW95_05445 [Actinobacteria bacterium]|nr:hypothetical protein [Actinomycetota bacterium]